MPTQVLHIARRLSRAPDTSPAMLSFAWNLLETMYNNLGWGIPTEPELARCRSAAQSSAHACRLAVEDIRSQLPSHNGPVTVLNSLTFSESLFGRWDMIPPVSTVIVPLDDSDSQPLSATTIRASRGIWHAGPGRLREEFMSGEPSNLFDSTLLPTPAAILATTAPPAFGEHDTSSLFFCAALRACSKLDAWDHAWEIASLSEVQDHVVMAADTHGLRLPIPRKTSLAFRLKLLFGTLGKSTSGS